ncbi:MAG: hypothetical protein AAF629_24265 [Chloroflexota bacterium]
MPQYKTITHSHDIQITGTPAFNRVAKIVLDNLRRKQARAFRKLRRQHLIVQQADLPLDGPYATTAKIGPAQHIKVDMGRMLDQVEEELVATDVLIGILIDQIARIIIGNAHQKTQAELNAQVDELTIQWGFVNELAELRALEYQRLSKKDG